MRKASLLTEEQRSAVLALFEEGYGHKAVATRLHVGRGPVKYLHSLWRIRGSDALVAQSSRKSFAYETKIEVVRRFCAGEPKVALAQEFGISHPKTVSAWARIWEQEGEEGLRPKPKGRRRKNLDAPAPELTEMERLQQENEYLRVENAYLKKLKALRAQERQ